MALSVYVTRRVPDAGLDILRAHCEKVDVNAEDRVLRRDELLDRVRGRDGVLCLLTDTIDGEVMDAAEGCKVFANYAVGYDNIDVPAATERGIAITNTPGVLTDATSDLAWSLIFAAARRIPEADRYTREGEFKIWGPMLFLGGDLTERTLGIVGAGRIGTAVGLKSAGFRMTVLYTDQNRNQELEAKVGAKRVELDALLAEADVVTLHVPLNEETRHLIGKRELELMKPTACLINTSRGAVIDEAALVQALKNGTIAGAGLDVYENEPELTPGLAEQERAVLVPHIGSATVWTRSKMAEMAASNLVAVLEGKKPPNCVNPEVVE